MIDGVWLAESQNMSYNSWLREEAQSSRNLLRKNTARLLAQLSVLDSVILQEETTSERFGRVSLAMVHLMTELHLLVISTERGVTE